MDTKQHTCETTTFKLAANLPESFPQCSTKRHPNRPGKLHILDVFADNLSIFVRKKFQPLPNWFTSRGYLIKGSGQSFHMFS